LVGLAPFSILGSIKKGRENMNDDQTYGALTEGAHIAGYSLERTMQKLESLLEGDKWKSVGGGFDDVNDFLSSIKLDSFRLVAEQRKRIAARIKELQPDASNRQIAKTLGTSEMTVRRDTATNVAQPIEIVNQINESKPPTATNDAVSGAVAAKMVARAEGREERREERLDKLAEISLGNVELGTATRFPIIYADPPWRYENPPVGGSNRSIENHYPTMTLEELCALPVGELATDDAMLYLWATAPKLAECFYVVTAWGFQYRTCLVWDKEVIGMGYHARNQHELLLVCKRGEIPPPLAGTQPASVYRERRGEHSAKPDFYYEMIEAAYPQLPKIELFSRSQRDGWSVWGNQSVAA
jgi:N6-adenosine-specific RNA methylase IME4